MKRILFDTNVVLDVLLDRQPHVEASAAAWAAVETGIAHQQDGRHPTGPPVGTGGSHSGARRQGFAGAVP